MGIFPGLYSGRESLMTHATAMSSVADNLANSNTPGFKNGRLEFGDLLAESIGSLYGSPITTGNGVRGEQITVAHHQQGTIEPTGRPLDVAIDGRGYFVVNNGENNLYTRAGNFVTDAEGALKTVTGESVMGFAPGSPEELVPLTTSGITGAAVASTTATLTGNLDAEAPLVVALPGADATPTQITNATSFQTSISVFDSLGGTRDLSLNFFRTGPGEWTVRAYADAESVGGAPGTAVPVGESTITFDALGQQAEGAVSQIVLNPQWANGAEPGNITVDLSQFTGFAGSSALTGNITDGNAAGSVEGYSFTEDGNFVALLSNGERVTIGQVALAMFQSETGLERAGDNLFLESTDSGAPSFGNPGTEGRGDLKTASIEASTVDIAKEFVDMIRYQRGYQSGTQVINTISDLVDTTLQIA